MNQLGLHDRLDDWILTLKGSYDWVWTSSEQADTLCQLRNFVQSSLSTDAVGNLFRNETGERWEAGTKYEPTCIDGLITASILNINRNIIVGPDPTNPLVQAAVGRSMSTAPSLEGGSTSTASPSRVP